MKRLISATLGLVLLAAPAVPANAASYEVYQRTLSTFSPSSKSLSSTQKAQIKAAVDANPAAEKFICTGIRYVSDPTSVNILVRSRAKAACEYAKQLNPNLSTWYQNKPTNARSYAGKVLLTVKTPDGEQTFENYNAAAISKVAFDSVQALLKTKPETISKPNIIAGPNVTKAQIDLETSRLTDSIRFWSDVYNSPYDAYLYTGKDVDWLIAQLEARGNPHWNQLIRSNYWQTTGKCAQSAANPMPGNNHFIQCVEGDYEEVRYSNIFAHEYAHLPLMTNALNQPSGIFSQLPVWLNEGAAQFFSIALTNQADDPNSRYWHDVHLNGSRDTVKLSSRSKAMTLAELLPTITAEETKEFFTSLESQSALSNSHPYSMGTWASEVLVAIEGADKFQQFLLAMNSNTDWKAAFTKTYGLDVSEFYTKLASYLNWVGKAYER